MLSLIGNILILIGEVSLNIISIYPQEKIIQRRIKIANIVDKMIKKYDKTNDK